VLLETDVATGLFHSYSEQA